MNLEKNFKDQTLDKIKHAQDTAPSEETQNQLLIEDSAIASEFIKGKYDINKFRENLGKLPDLGGIAVFETLPEFIQAIRQLGISIKQQNEILDHENAHALEALQRGYNIKYEIRFARDKKRLFILNIIRTKCVMAGVNVDYFNKSGREPNGEDLRSDLIAILSAPENLTDGKLSDFDKIQLGNN